MSYLIDANIFLRMAQPQHVMHADALDAVIMLLDAEEEVFLIPQVLYEFWTVATRPAEARDGLGFTPAEAETAVKEFLSDFPLLPDPNGLFVEWLQFVSTYSVCGRSAHDARIAAAMHLHGIKRILTFNTDDFQRYPMIQAIRPEELLRSPPPIPSENDEPRKYEAVMIPKRPRFEQMPAVKEAFDAYIVAVQEMAATKTVWEGPEDEKQFVDQLLKKSEAELAFWERLNEAAREHDFETLRVDIEVPDTPLTPTEADRLRFAALATYVNLSRRGDDRFFTRTERVEQLWSEIDIELHHARQAELARHTEIKDRHIETARQHLMEVVREMNGPSPQNQQNTGDE